MQKVIYVFLFASGSMSNETSFFKVWPSLFCSADFIILQTINPVGLNSDQSQTSHCNIKGLSVSEFMRIENMITQVKFS